MREPPLTIYPVILSAVGVGGIIWGASIGENEEGISLVWASVFCLVVGLSMGWYMWKHPEDRTWDGVPAWRVKGATLDWLGGNCPVQAEGFVDEQPFYFRGRGNWLEFWVGEPGAEDAYLFEEEYSGDAGWIPKAQAIAFIKRGIRAWRTGR